MAKPKPKTTTVGNKKLVCSCRAKDENSPLGKPHVGKKAPAKKKGE